jgi:hypothetical protein
LGMIWNGVRPERMKPTETMRMPIAIATTTEGWSTLRRSRGR